jgi:hypothetical protein
MVERVVKAATAGWRLWAIGAALSMGCAALMFFRRRRSRTVGDPYHEWWRHRDAIRANGDQASPPDSHHAGSPQLFL